MSYFAANRPAAPFRVLVVGDSYTAGSDEGGKGAAGWASLVDEQLEEVVVTTSAAGGSGYVTAGPSGQTFPDLIEAAGGGFDVVVFFGSRNDVAPPGEVRAAAEAAFATAREKSPDAALLVIGPPWVNDDPPSSVLEASTAVRAAAETAGGTWVDPLADGWFHDRPELIGSDGIHPTDEGHRYMAGLIGPALRRALGS